MEEELRCNRHGERMVLVGGSTLPLPPTTIHPTAMKTPFLLFALTCGACLADEPKTNPPAAPTGERLEHLLTNPGPRVLEKFDADKDGKLSDEEKSKAREAIKARTGEVMDKAQAKFDTNGDGKLDEAERAKAREAIKGQVGPRIRERLLKRFDKDGDGKLNEAERAKAKEVWEQHLAEKN